VSGPINVDVPAMLAAVGELENTHDNIKGQVTHLENEFAALATSWQGDAASQFQNAMQGFYEECDNVLKALGGLAQSVVDSAVGYEKAHNMSTDIAQALQNSVSASNTQPGLAGF
jgi:WXG100 family type VII secretion target